MKHPARGYTMVELLTVLALMGIALGTSALFFRSDVGSLADGTSHVQGFFSQTRAKAMAATSAVRVSPTGTTKVIGEIADSCSSGTWVSDPALRLELPKGVHLSDTSWSLCFNDRGITETNLVVTLQDEKGGTSQIEVLVGGTTRLLP